MLRSRCLKESQSDDNFLIETKDRDYRTQYASIYFMRLTLLRPVLMQLATARWSNHARHTPRVLDVMQGGLTWLVGTLYMDMPLKPQVLQDLVADVNLSAAVPQQSWRDPRRDVIQLEDDSGRICIIGQKLQESMLCTGIVVAVLGSETASEEFEVIDIIFPGSPDASKLIEFTSPQPGEAQRQPLSADLTSLSPTGMNEYIAFISGLNLTGASNSALALTLLKEYLTGELLLSDDQTRAAQISTLVIAGDSIRPSERIEDDAMTRKLTKNKKYGYDSASFDSRPLDILDEFLADICQTLDVIVMPGAGDPTNATLPQQPLNSIMLRRAARFNGSTLQLRTNPTYLQTSTRTLFGVSGQTVDNIGNYITTDISFNHNSSCTQSEHRADTLDIAEHTLKWRHCAPTAPDTLWTYPYSDKDPFLIDQYPDIYFIGNRNKFSERLVINENRQNVSDAKQCKVIGIPRFSDSAELVLLNLATLETELILFSGNVEKTCTLEA